MALCRSGSSARWSLFLLCTAEKFKSLLKNPGSQTFEMQLIFNNPAAQKVEHELLSLKKDSVNLLLMLKHNLVFIAFVDSLC